MSRHRQNGLSQKHSLSKRAQKTRNNTKKAHVKPPQRKAKTKEWKTISSKQKKKDKKKIKIPIPTAVIHVRNSPNDRQSFKIAKAILCQSPFFKAAFDDISKDERDGFWHLNLPETGPKAFGMIVRCLEDNQLCEHFSPDGKGTPPTYEKLVQAWLLGERFQFSVVQNEAIRFLERARQYHGEITFPASFIRYIYTLTADARSPLRRYVTQVYLRFTPDQDLDVEEYPLGFIIDIEMAMDSSFWVNDESGKCHESRDTFTPEDLTMFYV